MTAIQGIRYRRGSRRAFWLGFALFGWMYWAMSFGPWFDGWVMPNLLLTHLIRDFGFAMHPQPEFEGQIRMGSSEDFAARYAFAIRDNFVQIGKSLAVLVVALLGGLVATAFSLEERRASHPPSPPETDSSS
jgi:hypothetical protein